MVPNVIIVYSPAGFSSIYKKNPLFLQSIPIKFLVLLLRCWYFKRVFYYLYTKVILIPEKRCLKSNRTSIYIQAPRCVTATSRYVATMVGQGLEGRPSASRFDWPQPLTATSKYGTDAPFIKVKTHSARDQFQSGIQTSRSRC